MKYKCLVLDLDETLVHTVNEDKEDYQIAEKDANEETKTRLYTIEDNKTFMWGVIRPYYKDFLDSCFTNFDIIGVWSTGTKAYVEDIVKIVFQNNNYTPNFILSRKDCDHIYEANDGYKHILFKHLKKLYYDYEELDKDNTIIIDDNLEVTCKNSLSHIYIPRWEGDHTDINKDDRTLICYKEWIDSVDFHNYESMKYIPLPKLCSKKYK